MRKSFSFTAGERDAGRRLEALLKERLGLSRAQIRRAKFTDGGITVNGTRRRTTYPAVPGDLVVVSFAEADTAGKVEPNADGGLLILYEDGDVLAVHKPPGMACHPAHGHYRDTLANLAAAHYAAQGLSAPVRQIGRLDRDTSGIVLLAKSRIAAARLSSQRERGELSKAYLALAEGVFRETEGCIRLPLSKKVGEKNEMEASPDGKSAATHYRVLAQEEGRALLLCRLETGRTHQIRAHLAAVGHPLVGDVVYGGGTRTGSRLGLHAAALRFFQPSTGEEIRLAAELLRDPVFGTRGRDELLLEIFGN